MELTPEEIAAFRAQLLRDRAALDEADALGQDGRKTVELDQQAIGRLSRMDAIQHQAMANAGHRRRDATRLRIDAALARMDQNEFGFCTDCGEPIPVRRLEIDPATPRCVSCING